MNHLSTSPESLCHPDYLGSIEWVTNADGRPVEYFWYSPWGETLQADNSWRGRFSSPFKFTGHIEDEETGLTYAGARYYPARESQWLSVDPLAHEFPSYTPYHYVHNNPVNLVDPDGKQAFPVIPLIPIIIGLIFAPKPVNAPSHDEKSNSRAMEEANNQYGLWLIYGAAGGAALGSARTARVFLAEEAFGYYTGLPCNPKDIIQLSKSLGRAAPRFFKGSSDKVIIIGENMKDVNKYKSRFTKKPETFTPSDKARDEYTGFVEKYGSPENIPDDVLRNSQGFRENKKWIQDKINDGYSILDVGIDPNRQNRSIYYQMETEILNSNF